MRKLVCITVIILCGSPANAQLNVSTLTPTFKGSGGVTIDDTGNVYIADFGDFLGGADTDGIPNHVMKLDPSMNLTVFANDFTGASGNEFDSNGVLFQADIRDNAVYKIVNGSRVLYTSEGLNNPVGIAFDSDNNLYVCNCGLSNIRKITPAGISTVFSTGNGLFSCPNGMTIDENDNLYVVNFSNTDIVKVDPNGTASSIGNTPGGNGHLDYDINTNHLYIASFGTNRIYYLDLDNTSAGVNVLAGTGVAGNTDGPAMSSTFSAPNGIAVSKTGDSLFINSSATLNNANLNPQYVRLITNVLSTLSTNDLENFGLDINVYPNPTNTEICIEADSFFNPHSLSLEILNLKGQIVKVFSEFESNSLLKFTIDVSDLDSGVYFYSLKSGENKIKNGKLVKN